MTLAVLGLGSMGLRHARNILALGKTVAGFDPDPAAPTEAVRDAPHNEDPGAMRALLAGEHSVV